ncbi:MAG TPA: hypothetical protein VGP69_02940 [Gaiellaceae bacterium]|jgi:hypothetical protein|nr:hypothetical protein [Gaiellaceae bacterium]
MRTVLATAVAAATLLAPAATARVAFSGDPCKLVTTKQVAAFGVPTACKPTTLKGPGFTASDARWNPKATGAQPHLFVGVNTYASRSGPVWQIGIQTLSKLPGHAKKVSGIGSAAYESGGDGSTLSVINFVVGNQIVDINLRTPTPPTSLAQLNALAKSVAAKL